MLFAQLDNRAITEAIRQLAERSGMETYEVRSKLTTIAMTCIMDVSRLPLGCSCGCDARGEECDRLEPDAALDLFVRLADDEG